MAATDIPSAWQADVEEDCVELEIVARRSGMPLVEAPSSSARLPFCPSAQRTVAHSWTRMSSSHVRQHTFLRPKDRQPPQKVSAVSRAKGLS